MGKIIHRDSVPAVPVHKPPHDRTIKVFASPFTDRSTVQFAVGLTSMEPGKVHEVHSHDPEEVIYVLAGRGQGQVGGQPCELRAGTIIQIASNESHGFTNNGDEILELLWVTSPPGREKNFLPADLGTSS